MPKILIVDDEVHIIKIVEHKLRGAGYGVIAAADGIEALEKAREEKPDLILLDVMMPRQDGFHTVARLKGDPTTRGIPIVMLTVRGKEIDQRRGREMGVLDYITKPFSPRQLLDRVDQLFENLRAATPHPPPGDGQ